MTEERAEYINKHILGQYIAGSNAIHRFRSWEYCYRYFQWLKIHPASFEEVADVACLHLGFYLASWGMYRGSSFLLRKSFQIHKRPIRELLKRKYDALWQVDIGTLSKPKIIKTIFELAKALRKLYPKEITDTLLTKILLGTVGCTPAYDRLFKLGCKKRKVRPFSNFNERSLKAFIQFFQVNAEVFTSINNSIKYKSGIFYPPMKLIDMFFWSVGSNQNYYWIKRVLRLL